MRTAFDALSNMALDHLDVDAMDHLVAMNNGFPHMSDGLASTSRSDNIQLMVLKKTKINVDLLVRELPHLQKVVFIQSSITIPAPKPFDLLSDTNSTQDRTQDTQVLDAWSLSYMTSTGKMARGEGMYGYDVFLNSALLILSRTITCDGPHPRAAQKAIEGPQDFDDIRTLLQKREISLHNVGIVNQMFRELDKLTAGFADRLEGLAGKLHLRNDGAFAHKCQTLMYDARKLLKSMRKFSVFCRENEETTSDEYMASFREGTKATLAFLKSFGGFLAQSEFFMASEAERQPEKENYVPRCDSLNQYLKYTVSIHTGLLLIYAVSTILGMPSRSNLDNQWGFPKFNTAMSNLDFKNVSILPPQPFIDKIHAILVSTANSLQSTLLDIVRYSTFDTLDAFTLALREQAASCIASYVAYAYAVVQQEPHEIYVENHFVGLLPRAIMTVSAEAQLCSEHPCFRGSNSHLRSIVTAVCTWVHAIAFATHMLVSLPFLKRGEQRNTPVDFSLNRLTELVDYLFTITKQRFCASATRLPQFLVSVTNAMRTIERCLSGIIDDQLSFRHALDSANTKTRAGLAINHSFASRKACTLVTEHMSVLEQINKRISEIRSEKGVDLETIMDSEIAPHKPATDAHTLTLAHHYAIEGLKLGIAVHAAAATSSLLGGGEFAQVSFQRLVSMKAFNVSASAMRTSRERLESFPVAGEDLKSDEVPNWFRNDVCPATAESGRVYLQEAGEHEYVANAYNRTPSGTEDSFITDARVADIFVEIGWVFALGAKASSVAAKICDIASEYYLNEFSFPDTTPEALAYINVTADRQFLKPTYEDSSPSILAKVTESIVNIFGLHDDNI